MFVLNCVGTHSALAVLIAIRFALIKAFEFQEVCYYDLNDLPHTNVVGGGHPPSKTNSRCLKTSTAQLFTDSGIWNWFRMKFFVDDAQHFVIYAFTLSLLFVRSSLICAVLFPMLYKRMFRSKALWLAGMLGMGSLNVQAFA